MIDFATTVASTRCILSTSADLTDLYKYNNVVGWPDRREPHRQTYGSRSPRADSAAGVC